MFQYREWTDQGRWVTHLIGFDTMADGLDYAAGLKAGQPWQVVKAPEGTPQAQ